MSQAALPPIFGQAPTLKDKQTNQSTNKHVNNHHGSKETHMYVDM